MLFGLVPSGVVLAFDAKGGAAVTLGFLCSATITALGIVLGVVAARRRDFATHRRAMRHVVAQMSVAVSSRLLIVALDLAGMAPETAYVAALWAPVIASALAAELLGKGSSFRVSPSVERIRLGYFARFAILRMRAVLRPAARPSR